MNMIIKLKYVNPENLLCGSRNVVLYGDFNVLYYLFKNHIQKSALTIYPDSTAVEWLLKYWYHYKTIRQVSTDLQEELLDKAVFREKIFFLFGDTDEVLNRVSGKLKARYNKINIAGMMNGFNFDSHNVLNLIKSSGTDILFVGLGAARQEKWILDNFSDLDIPLIISVGGWFQYLAGIKERSPFVFRKLHLEWFHKLTTEFRRVWKRYLLILPLFIYKVITGKIELELVQ